MQVYLRTEPRALILVSSAAASSRGPGLLNGEKPRRQQSVDRVALVLSTFNSADDEKAASAGASSSTASLSASRAVIETVSIDSLPDLAALRSLHASAQGCLGLINVGSDLFVAIVKSATEVGNIRPGEMVMKIHQVAFHCLNKSLWDEALPEDSFGGALDPQGPTALPHEAGYNGGSSTAPIVEHPCLSLQKLLSTGTFYYAQGGTFDLSQRLGRRLLSPKAAGKRRKAPPAPRKGAEGRTSSTHSQWQYDARFVWNTYMVDPLLEYRSRLEPAEREALDRESLLLLAIQGYVGAVDFPRGSIALVSRLSWKRAGTRYNTRGIDDDGNVANFAESETLYTVDNSTMSYVQVRGSVPLFWEQQGLQAFNARIQITRSRAASQPAFDRHFAELLSQYKHVHALNLLGTRDAETVLTAAYAEHMRNSEAVETFLAQLSKEDGITDEEHDDLDRIGLTNFDYHTISRVEGGLDGVRSELRRLEAIQLKRHAFGYTLVDANFEVRKAQRGFFRTNCLDCLDRTNVIQDMLSQDALQLCLDSAADGSGLMEVGANLWVNHRNLWAENGDALSKIYAGTGALNTSSTRTGVSKKTLGGLLSDAAKSASRLYINNFQDKSKQNVIDSLLGNTVNQRPVSVYDPLHDSVNAELTSRMDEFSTERKLTVFAGTWNLAGRAATHERLLPFLFPTPAEPDVIAIGLQEVVPLTPQQILLTDPDKLRVWEGVISDAIAKRPEAKARYISLRSEQLVGTALIIIIKETMLPFVRQVEAATKKTGMRGMSGNKGGVAIRLNIYDTSFCFVTAHFAAGKANVDERNADFATISRGLTFFSGRTISNCSYAFWFGDFNYRIDGGNEIVRPLCDDRDLDALASRDQLLKAKSNNLAFSGYEEGPLTFLPTYKYDFNSQHYDTSEKMRVPAWTDRVLARADHPFHPMLRTYGRAELLTSDHRPVYALFDCSARLYDNDKRNALRRELFVKYKSHQSRPGTLIDLGDARDSDIDSAGEGQDGYETSELPEPSSDNAQNWWDDALSEGEESGDEDPSSKLYTKSTSNGHANPFANRPQYAQWRKPQGQGASPRNLSAASSLIDVGEGSGSGDGKETSGAGEIKDVAHRGTLLAGAFPVSADTLNSNGMRRKAPQPPAKKAASTAPASASPISSSSDAQGSVKARAKPPIPPKKKANGDMLSPSVATAVDPEARSSPQLPARPKLGSRSQSYQSQRSLLDDSE